MYTLDVIDIAINAERDLYSKQYSSMAKHTAEIMSFILECGDSLHKNKTSPLLAKSVDVLRQARDPSFCFTFLKSRPGGPGKDLGDLGSYTLGILHEEGALGFVKRAQQDLENSDYISVNLHAAAVIDFADDCLSDDNIPIKDTSSLPKNASVVKNIAEITDIISNMLM
ncbi:hypothetical protein QL285_058899 [Trifolium repens]|nr:hypothetical protein QL285_058899 [Trifolium repens]